MQRTKYAPEFKDEAVKQVVVRGQSVVDVAKRLVTLGEIFLGYFLYDFFIKQDKSVPEEDRGQP